ncbi:ribonuclease inhibitor, partial [Citrobacter sp. AAK_AS5]
MAGKSGESPLIKRLHLPADHDDRMPPAGKPQPSAEEIALLAWWIDAGADTQKTARDLGAPEDILKLLARGTSAAPV